MGNKSANSNVVLLPGYVRTSFPIIICCPVMYCAHCTSVMETLKILLHVTTYFP